MAIARKRLQFDGRGRSIEYVAPMTITREIPDGTGRREVVIVKHERLSFSEAVQRGLMDHTGKVTELGGSNLLDDERAMREISENATKKRADTIQTLVVPEHSMFKKEATVKPVIGEKVETPSKEDKPKDKKK